MKAKTVRIRQWLLFAVLVTVALCLHLSFPVESVAPGLRDHDIDADEAPAGPVVSDALANASSAGTSGALATVPADAPRRDAQRTPAMRERGHAGATATEFDTSRALSRAHVVPTPASPAWPGQTQRIRI